MIVGRRPVIFALNRCSSVSKFEHGQAQAMGIDAARSNPTGRPDRNKTQPSCSTGRLDAPARGAVRGRSTR